MPGFKEANTSLGITIQPTPGLFNEPGVADLIAMYSPDNGSDAVQTDDPTLTGATWAAPRQFIGRRGRAGATVALRGPGGTTPPLANAHVLGRIFQAAGFTEFRNAAAITGTAAAGGSTSSIILDAAASSIDDFYMGYPIQHANIGAGRAKGTSIVRDYIGASKTAILCETLASAVTGGQFTIPPFLGYILSTGASVPLLSAKMWRHRKAYRYRDCTVSSFAINIPVTNNQTQDLPSVEFALTGVPEQSTDELAPIISSSLLTPIPPNKAGKFAFNGLKVGHQSMRLEFGLETGAPPNANFDTGQEPDEIVSGTRTLNLDLNEQLRATLDLDALVDNQTIVPVLNGWGSAAGQTIIAALHNAVLDPFSPTPRNGFLGVTGGGVPTDIDRAIALMFPY